MEQTERVPNAEPRTPSPGPQRRSHSTRLGLVRVVTSCRARACICYPVITQRRYM